MKHEPQSTDFKTILSFDPVRSVVTCRVPCSCGWAGGWYADRDYADRSFERHVKQSAAPVHVVGCVCRECAASFVYEAL